MALVSVCEVRVSVERPIGARATPVSGHQGQQEPPTLPPFLCVGWFRNRRLYTREMSEPLGRCATHSFVAGGAPAAARLGAIVGAR